METSFNRILARESSLKNSRLCIGLDIDSDRMPNSMDKSISGMKKYLFDIVDATTESCVAYKLNMAFYERYGSQGYRMMEEVVDYINRRSLTIADGKRGDIGNTTKKYALSVFDTMGFDSVTVSPYMGEDSITPFIENKSKGVFVLCLTSNKSARDIQLIFDGNSNIYNHVSNLASKLNNNDNIGLVVGATKPEYMSKIREMNNLPWLIPGIGAQGGDLENSVRISNSNSSVGIINVSRSIIFAGNCTLNDINESAKTFNAKINSEV